MKNVKIVRARFNNMLTAMMVKKEEGVSDLVIQAGLIIAGVALLVVFVGIADPFLTSIMNTCKDKALEIFN